MKSIDPTHNTLIKEYSSHSHQEVVSRIQSTHEAFKEWSKLDISERGHKMRVLADLLHAEVEEHAKLIAQEMGKPLKQARAELLKCASACRYYADHSKALLQNEQVQAETSKSTLHFEPLGLILCIMPWNFPYWQVFRCAVPALMAGNGILLKHAPNVFGCALAIENLFERAGFSPSLFSVLLIDVEAIEEVIADRRIRGVSFTGSVKGGKSVGGLAGKHIKKSVLELGGSDPFIVLDDVEEMQKCIDTAIQARLNNAGQSCIAPKRFIIMRGVYQEFCDGLLKGLETIKVGDPFSEETDVGPLARLDLVENLDRQVQDSVQQGALLLTGGKRPDRVGFFYVPTVIAGAKKGMPIYDEELFGPVFTLISVDTEEEAIRIANDTIYGLGGSVWTGNIERGERVARRLETGSVYINARMVSNVALPFGGVKSSGYGRELSHYGLKEFVNIKTVCSHS